MFNGIPQASGGGIIVDTLNFDQSCKGQESKASAHDWIMGLTEELMDNEFDHVITCGCQS